MGLRGKFFFKFFVYQELFLYTIGSMEENFVKRYDALVIDSVNFAYRTFKIESETPVRISKKTIYKDSICNFIDKVEDLKGKYLKSDGQVYLLFDNYFSKADLRSMYMFANRKELVESYKANRKKESKEFYNSLNFLRYFYLIGPEQYHTIRIDNLEADDLVKPLFEKIGVIGGDTSALMVTTDLDWARYLSESVDWLPRFNETPEDVRMLSDKLGFKVTEKSIIAYKALFGDPSDNIKGIVTHNSKNLEEFKELMEKCNTADELLFLARATFNTEEKSILGTVRDNEKAYIINMQLVDTIACSKETLACSLTTGRNATSLYSTVRKAIGLDGPEKFTFGNVRRNRIS